MAEEKKEKSGIGTSIGQDVLDEGVKEGSKYLAHLAVENMPAEMLAWFIAHPKSPLLIKAGRLLIPNKYKLANEAVSDFASALQLEIQAKAKSPGKTAVPTQPQSAAIETQIAQYARICEAVIALSQEDRDRFMTWLLGLTKEKREALYRLVEKIKDPQVKNYLQMMPADLERLIDGVPQDPSTTPVSKKSDEGKSNAAELVKSVGSGIKQLGTGIGEELQKRQPGLTGLRDRLKSRADKMKGNVLEKEK